ncbi:MAG: pectin acetylesterase-family hydrolase [Pseudomonadales bacterium]|nr:pectin acetylesterase-family hydrolase [Pseudomonadales bacterium]
MKKYLLSLALSLPMLALLAALLPAAAQAQDSSLPAMNALAPGWNTLPTDGLCASGTPYQFYVRDVAQSDKLLIYFNGGGACWFGQACDLSSEPNVHYPFADMDANNPALAAGIFSLDNPANPFADYDIVSVPYCTGDVHIGAGERQYQYNNADGQPVTISTHHNGYANSTTVLDWVYANIGNPERIVMAGSSAGAIGASFYAGLVAEHYRDKPVVLLADAAGGYNSPTLAVTFKAWNTAAILPAWPEYAGKTNDNLTFEDFYIASAQRNPNLRLAQYNAAEDRTQVSFSLLIGDKPGSFSLPQRIFNHYVEIESAVDEFYSYTAGGPVHTILASPIFYDYQVEGVRFADWTRELIEGREIRDISCVNEVNGCTQAPGQ